MDFDLQWLLWGLPLAFALGWLASRLDVRQWRRERRDTLKAYLEGLNLLLDEQHDKAIDAFIVAVQHDPNTSDLHFALGNLFRRRGEYQRAVRVHEHLLQRADLAATERDRARHALAQDFLEAGLFDRAEQAFKALEGTLFDTEARLALLTLYERSRDWRAAIDVASRLEKSGAGSFATRIAHDWCELSLEALARGQPTDADVAIAHARHAAAQAPRPLIMAGRQAVAAGRHADAFDTWSMLLPTHAAAFVLVAVEYATAALACGRADAALAQLQAQQAQQPSLELLKAIGLLDDDPSALRARLIEHQHRRPTLAGALALLERDDATDEMHLVREALSRAVEPQRRYRCNTCGFEAQHHHWRCPGCQSWDSYPPLTLAEDR